MKKNILIVILAFFSITALGQKKVDLGNELVSRIVGEWTNVDPNTGGVVKIVITNENNQLMINAFGNCTPTYCEWGKVRAREIAATAFEDENYYPFDYLLAHWEIDGKTKNAMSETMKIEIKSSIDPQLLIEIITLFNDDSGRSDCHSYAIMTKTSNSGI